MHITNIFSRQILDSRGRPTLETTVEVDAGVVGVAAVPSGASTGSHEAVELRDGDATHYQGLGVLKAVEHVTGPIARALKGMDVREQQELDQAMIDLDGTVNKSKLGANAILSVSLASMRASAALSRQPLYRAIQSRYDFPELSVEHLPRPMMNVINGGMHANNGLKIQEFMIVPDGQTVAERIERGATTYQHLSAMLKSKKLSTNLGDEGGFAPTLKDDAAAMDLLVEAVTTAGYTLPGQVGLALDAASSTFYDAATQSYHFGSTKNGLTGVGMAGIFSEWLEHYPLISIEDPLAEDDWDGWADMTKKIGARTMIVGDDVFVTNRGRLERGIAAKAGNAILIKLNQIGTLTETIETIQAAQAAGYTCIISHRSGETTDSFIADLAVASGAPFIKAGAPARGERVAKYNRLLQIEQELGA